MVVTCPHCHASYQLTTTIRNAVLVCHRCGTEFSPDQKQEEAQPHRPETASPSLFDWKQPSDRTQPTEAKTTNNPAAETPAASHDAEMPHFLLHQDELLHAAENDKKHSVAKPAKPTTPPRASDNKQQDESGDHMPSRIIPSREQAMPDAHAAPRKETIPDRSAELPKEEKKNTETNTGETADSIAPPARRKTRIWPWLLFILLAAGGTGLWFKQDIWLQNIWVRSLLLNLDVPLPLQSRDWHIPPKSVQSQWLTRDDQTRILVIEGTIENRLYSDLPPPKLKVRLFDLAGAPDPVTSRTLPITEPPGMAALKKRTYHAPPVDTLPIVGQGSRGFVLVLDSLPKGVRDFSLTPVPAL